MKKTKTIVQKYGGSSVKDADRIKAVAERIVSYKKNDTNVAVVVSAMADTTDDLIELAVKIAKDPTDREMDLLLSTGEQISCALLAMAVRELGFESVALTGFQVGVLTNKEHGKARVHSVDDKRLKKAFKEGKIVIVAGYQGITEDGEITTLGRGGSDLSAVALAKAIRADVCEIYTDVTGIYTTDPRMVPEARKLKEITFDEMLEMASLGAQVMQARSIEVAKRFNIPLHVRSSYSKEEGTMIVKTASKIEDIAVTGVTSNKNEAKITVCAVPDQPGISAKIFNAIAKAGVNVDVIVQNVSHTRKTDISFTVPKAELPKALEAAAEVSAKIGAGEVLHSREVARVSIVGSGMRSHQGIAARMFEALAQAGINIEMIATSEISISCIIALDKVDAAVKVLHRKFALDKG
ncbi:MAG: aspartate kinase [Candidatus Omnitrophica bacterium]|nr:aspartate kinase [Candidatus Omnitrophota bacterium]